MDLNTEIVLECENIYWKLKCLPENDLYHKDTIRVIQLYE